MGGLSSATPEPRRWLGSWSKLNRKRKCNPSPRRSPRKSKRRWEFRLLSDHERILHCRAETGRAALWKSSAVEEQRCGKTEWVEERRFSAAMELQINGL